MNIFKWLVGSDKKASGAAVVVTDESGNVVMAATASGHAKVRQSGGHPRSGGRMVARAEGRGRVYQAGGDMIIRD